MAKGIKTGGGSRKGCPNKRQRLHFDDIAARVTESLDLAAVFCSLLRATAKGQPDLPTRIDALKIFCEFAFVKPKQQHEYSMIEFSAGNLIPQHEQPSTTVN